MIRTIEAIGRPKSLLTIEQLCDGVRDGGFSGPCHTAQQKNARNVVSVRAVDPLNDLIDDRIASPRKTTLVGVKTCTIGIGYVMEVEIRGLIEINSSRIILYEISQRLLRLSKMRETIISV